LIVRQRAHTWDFEPAGAETGISTDRNRTKFANLSQMVGAEAAKVKVSAPAGQGRGQMMADPSKGEFNSYVVQGALMKRAGVESSARKR
jgi:hypothetical protein